MEIRKKLRAQILVIVLLVMLLLSIIVISIVAVVRRDLEQSLSSAQYEDSYNTTEAKITEILDKYADTDVALTSLVVDFPQNCTLPFAGSGECNYVDGNKTTKITVTETNDVVNYELGKDETFKMNLDNYRGRLDFEWTGEAALVLTLEYRDSAGKYRNIKDVYDSVGVYTNSGGVGDHAFTFTTVGDPSNSFRTNLATVAGISPSDSLVNLKIKPVSRVNESILINIDGESGLPNQVRKFEGFTYFETNASKTAAPTLISQLPLAGREPEILNYVLRTDEVVGK